MTVCQDPMLRLGSVQVFEEYERVCRPAAMDDTPCDVAESRHNIRLNRYFNVLPFDHNRVVLPVSSPLTLPLPLLLVGSSKSA